MKEIRRETRDEEPRSVPEFIRLSSQLRERKIQLLRELSQIDIRLSSIERYLVRKLP